MTGLRIMRGAVWIAAAACCADRRPPSPSPPPGIEVPASSFSLDAGVFIDPEWALWRASALIDTMVLPHEAGVVAIEARGTACEGTWPVMECTWNGTRVGRVRVRSTDWAWYRMERRFGPGTGVLRIALLNDRFSSRGDVNLYVRAVVVSGEKR